MAEKKRSQRKKEIAETPKVLDEPKAIVKSNRVQQISTVVISLFLISTIIFVYRNKLSVPFVAAKVGNKFILKSELNKQLNEKYGDRTLDELITVTLIKSELKAKKINVSKQEMDKEISDIEKNLGGTSIDDALAAEGMTRAQLEEQVYLQAGMKKLLGDKISVTEEEIAGFLTTYGSSLEGDDNSKREQAQNLLKDQKLQEEIVNWIGELKTKVKVTKYI